MQSRSITLGLLFGIFALGLLGAQQSYAIVYDITDDGTCGGLLTLDWDEDERTCATNDELIITAADTLNIITPDVTLFNEETITNDGIINNFGIIQNAGGDIANDGTINNSLTILQDEGDFNGDGVLNNLATGTITNEDGAVMTVSGTLDNLGTLENFGGYDIPIAGLLTNSGTITSIQEFIIAGTFTNTGTYDQTEGAFTVKGTATTTDTINLTTDTTAEVTGTLNIDAGTFTNDIELILKVGGVINIITTLDNTGTILNECGTITGTVTSNPPEDNCAITSITIDSPLDGSDHGNVVPVTFTGTAIDIDEFGSSVDISDDIVWTNDQGALLDDIGSSVSNVLPLGPNQITATITDSGSNSLFTQITINILVDGDGDGYVIPADCDDSDSAINPGAPELYGDGIDNNCDLLVDDGFTDADFDLFVFETINVLPGFTDCDDSDPAINPAATELYGDGVDNDCDVDIDEGFTDFDIDTYVFETINVLPGFTDCDDTQFTVNPGASELVDGVDTDCDAGTINADEVDGDTDTYIPGVIDPSGWLGPLPIPGEGDCLDTQFTVNPGASELVDGVDTDCDAGTINADEVDGDTDTYIPGVIDPSGWLGPLPIPGENDCDDLLPTVNPGASELLTNDGVDTDCDGSLVPSELDEDFDDYIVGTFILVEWLATPVPVGGDDCDDDDPTRNPGATEIANGVDDDCDGFVDEDIDNDGDSYLTPADCDDNNPEINPGATEIIGDGVDNNCDDSIDEIILITVDDSYVGDGDAEFSIPAPGILENDTIPLFVEELPVVYPVTTLLPVDVNLETSPVKGDVVLNSDGSFTYSPADPIWGSDSFEYSISYEGSFGSNTSTVTLTQTFCGKDIGDFDEVIVGTNGKDKLKGTNENDLILGLGGNDKIKGDKGDDCIYGGDGNDQITGNKGNDEIHGGDGKDKIKGDKGDDTLFGDDGKDKITGNNGDDFIDGGDGNDKITGNKGNDEIHGGNGNDKITGNKGMDEIHGGDGNDKISGNNDDDTLFGDDGNDKITGNNGDDFIDGGNDVDKCKGGKGTNTIINCESGEKGHDEDDKKGKGHDKHDD